jgi:integrase/recombinase XerD
VAIDHAQLATILLQVNHFAETTRITYLDDITAESIYEWLSRMEVSNQTKLTRLKCLKAFLSRCFSNGWIEKQYWKPITIRVDSNVKEGATEGDIRTLLSLLDLVTSSSYETLQRLY